MRNLWSYALWGLSVLPLIIACDKSEPPEAQDESTRESPSLSAEEAAALEALEAIAEATEGAATCAPIIEALDPHTATLDAVYAPLLDAGQMPPPQLTRAHSPLITTLDAARETCDDAALRDALGALAALVLDAIRVEVIALKWAWGFTYTRFVSSEALVVPAGELVRLDMTSNDVPHGLHVPDLGLDVAIDPEAPVVGWLKAPEASEHVLRCSIPCGEYHEEMVTRLRVLSDEDFEAWLDDGGPLSEQPPEQAGESLFSIAGCEACHALDATPGVGPALDGIVGQQRRGVDGTKRVVDTAYLATSITHPGDFVVEGYASKMPAFADLGPGMVSALVAYITSKTRAESPPP